MEVVGNLQDEAFCYQVIEKFYVRLDRWKKPIRLDDGG